MTKSKLYLVLRDRIRRWYGMEPWNADALLGIMGLLGGVVIFCIVLFSVVFIGLTFSLPSGAIVK